MKKLEKQEIELIQSFLTQEEAKIIIPQYIENFDEKTNLGELNCTNPAECLNDAFTWSDTPQKHHYWNKIHILLRERYYETIEGIN